MALISDDVLYRHTATGTATEVRARVSEYRTAGLDEVVLAGLADPEETRRALCAALFAVTEEAR